MENIKTVKVKVNGREIEVPENYTVLEAARAAKVNIPTLCYLKDINEIGACRICLTEVTGARGMVAACVYPVADGMEIKTNTEKVRNARKLNLELLLSNHDMRCLSCSRSTTCELQTLCNEYGIQASTFINPNAKEVKHPIDDSSVSIIRDNNKCILCRRCVAACANLQGIGVIGPNDRGYDTHIGSAYEMKLADTACINCGQCIVYCPTAALYERDDTQKVFDAISDPTKHVAICCAPSVRATLGESFGMEPGTDVEGKMVSAIRSLGFDAVYNMNLTADMTIVEEATELIDRIQNGGKLPMITSCSPGWIKYCEHYFPEFTENLSSCKSPQQMFGAIYKTYWAKKNNIDPKDIFFVSVIPCTAKKFEVGRENQSASGYPDVDVAITTRELASMITKTGIDFVNLEDEEFDSPFATATGAGEIFGATGGVMEAALRTAAELILGGKFEKTEFEEVRGTEGIKHAVYKVGDLDVKVAVCSGTANAKKLLRAIEAGEDDSVFVEVMACPGGCVNGGGQPYQPAVVRNNVNLAAVRAKVLYSADSDNELRKSHENPALKLIYDEYLGEFGSEKAHHILHTSYVKRGLYKNIK
jgi:NADP-reducing hydrogenase subunit HndD